MCTAFCLPAPLALPPGLPLHPTAPAPRERRLRCSQKSPRIALPSPPRAQKQNNAQVLLDRMSDTLLDARIHVSRLLRAQRPSPSGARIVVLGTGWAAHSLVKVIDLSAVKSVTLVSPRNFFFFTPLLSATAVGTIEFRSIVEPIRCANPFVDYFEACAVGVDLERRVVSCVEGEAEAPRKGGGVAFEVEYDVLVVAVGETTATFNVPGVREYAYFLKEITDARQLRRKLLDCLERASLPVWSDSQRRNLLHFIVVGGGPTGCEFAGELSDFVSKDLAPRYGAELVAHIRVTLLQSGASILTQFESSMQQQALDSFAGRIAVRTQARVVEVTATHIELKGGEQMPYGLLVWAAGNGTRPIVSAVLEAVGERSSGRRKIPVDPWFRVRGARNVFAIGDCATIEGSELPSTAQVAGQQGAYLGRLLSKAENYSLFGEAAPVLRDSGGTVVRPFTFLSLGIMAYLGNDNAVVQFEVTPGINLQFSGRVAYLLWRSVYAVKQVDVRNRVLVLFDYCKSRFYGRDISQF